MTTFASVLVADLNAMQHVSANVVGDGVSVPEVRFEMHFRGRDYGVDVSEATFLSMASSGVPLLRREKAKKLSALTSDQAIGLISEAELCAERSPDELAIQV
jgi:hypothetical protein